MNRFLREVVALAAALTPAAILMGILKDDLTLPDVIFLAMFGIWLLVLLFFWNSLWPEKDESE